MLSDLGRREEALAAAQEAVEIYRRLAAERPDAFLPDLAMSLNNLGEQAERPRPARGGARGRARRRSRSAAASPPQRPDAFLPDLARSLNNLGNVLSDLGRREDALAAAQEAVEIYRRLAAERPDAFRPDLAGSLNNLAQLLSDLGRREEALAAAQEAVELCRAPRRRSGPTPSGPIWRRRSTISANMLSDLGRREEALAAARRRSTSIARLAAAAARRLPARPGNVAQQPGATC